MKRRKVARGGIFAASAILIVGILIAIFLLSLNRYMEARILSRLRADFPDGRFAVSHFRVDMWRDFIGGDSIRIIAPDSSLIFSAGSMWVRGICWGLVRRGRVDSAVAGKAIFDLHKAKLLFPKTFYRVQCRRIHVSAPDSTADIDEVLFSPDTDDSLFFSISRFRKTGYRFQAPLLKIMGFDLTGAFLGKRIVTRSINLENAFFDAIASIYQPKNPDQPPPVMPVQALTSLPMKVQIASVNATNTRIQYREMYSETGLTAMIFFDHAQIAIRNITSTPNQGEAATVDANGNFMQSGLMHFSMYLPLDSKDLTFRYSGSVDALELREINSFLEASEKIRLDQGFLRFSKFDIDVVTGQARGKLYLTYQDLSISILQGNADTKRDIISWIANLEIRNNNTPPPLGGGKIGEVKWNKAPCESFFTFVWRCIRSGLGDVVGFKVKQKC